MSKKILTDELREKIRRIHVEEGVTIAHLAERFSLSTSTIENVLVGFKQKTISDRKAIENANPPFALPKSCYWRTRSGGIQIPRKPPR